MGFDYRQEKGVSVVELPMLNAAVGTSAETLWPESAAYSFPAAAATMQVSSASANDTAAGTGARTVLVEGLSSTYAAISETVTMNGQTQVATVNQYLRVNRLTVLTAGSGGANAGILYIGTGAPTAGKPAVVVNLIAAGLNKSMSGFYTVPLGKQAQVVMKSFSTGPALVLQVSMLTRAQGGLFVTREVLQHGQTPVAYQDAPTIPEKTDIEFRGVTDALTVVGNGMVYLLQK